MATHVRKKESGQSQSVAARWSDILAEWGFTPIANVFLENYGRLEITPTEAMLISHLMSFKWTEDAPYPSVPRLAGLMRCSERYVRKMCANLESVGLIKRVGREGTSNAFDLSGLFTKLEAIVIEEKVEAARRSQKKEQAAARKRKTTAAPQPVEQPLRRKPQPVEQPLRRTVQPPQPVELPVESSVELPVLRRTVHHPVQPMETGVDT